MPTMTGLLAIVLLPVALGVGAAAMIDGEAPPAPTGEAAEAAETPLRCEIAVARRGTGVVLEGLAIAQGPVSGTYRLFVSKSGGGGSASIVQGGEFAATPGEPAALGTVSLGGGGGRYTAELEATSDDGAVACGDRAQGAL